MYGLKSFQKNHNYKNYQQFQHARDVFLKFLCQWEQLNRNPFELQGKINTIIATGFLHFKECVKNVIAETPALTSLMGTAEADYLKET